MGFWLPTLAIFFFSIVVSADAGYAEVGGNEIYNPRVQSNWIRQAAFLSLGSVGLFLLVVPRPGLPRPQMAWTILLPVIALAIFLFTSVFWSDDMQMSLKRAITAILVVITGLGVGRVWTARQLAWGIVTVSTLFTIISVVVELKFRAFLNVDDYRFSGIFHPAKQAFSCGFLLLASLTIYHTERRRVMLLIAALAVCILILTKARTGTAAAFLAAFWLMSHFHTMRGWLISGFAGLTLVVACVFFYQGATGKGIELTKVTTMGRDEVAADPTKLTGRLPIWSHVFDEFTKRPILGYGYGAYWTMGRLAEFERLNGWALYHSHSTYFESLVNLGMIGFALGMCVLVLTFHRSLILVRQGDRQMVLTSALLILACVGGFSEIAFIGLEYESLVMMSAIGVTIFSSSTVDGGVT